MRIAFVQCADNEKRTTEIQQQQQQHQINHTRTKLVSLSTSVKSGDSSIKSFNC